jgi:hypothetical protein
MPQVLAQSLLEYAAIGSAATHAQGAAKALRAWVLTANPLVWVIAVGLVFVLIRVAQRRNVR